MKSERMKKWFINLAFFLFGLALIGWTASLTLDVMDLVLPNNPYTKYFALALYDGGVITWLFVYIGKAKGTAQRGISLALTVGDFIGVAMMVIGALYLGGQSLTDIPSWMGKALVNSTIIATLINLAGVYYYHANAPEVQEAIQAQELEDTLNEEALDQARFQVERRAQELGAIMANRVTARLKYRLRLPMTEQEYSEWQGETIDAEAYDPPALTARPMDEPGFWDYLKRFFTGKPSRQSSDMQQWKNSTDSPQEPRQLFAQTSDAAMAWRDMPNGERLRQWCKICRDEGKAWFSMEACEHVMKAKAEEQITLETAVNTLERLMSEPVAPEPPQA